VGFFVLVLLLETRASLSAQVCFFATIPYERSENRLKASAYALRIFQYVETIRFLSPLLGAGALPSPQNHIRVLQQPSRDATSGLATAQAPKFAFTVRRLGFYQPRSTVH
jgi:hypothetical protein